MKTCEYTMIDFHYCGASCEGSTMYCASHNRLVRKEIENARKESEKRKLKLSAPRPKQTAIKKVSDKRKSENEIYKEKRQEFLLKRWCEYHGKPCIPTEVHHSKGRIGALYLDERYWVALCSEAHKWVELNPKEAKEQGYSLSRLANNETI